MKLRIVTIVTVFAVLSLGGAGLALAAPAPEALHVQMTPLSANSLLFLESAEYAKDAPLPIPVKLAVPKGARVSWAGEVLGGDVSKDITARYGVTPKKDYDEVAFTLAKTRSAQVEAEWSGVTVKGDLSEISLAWVQRYPAGQVDFGFKAPVQDSVVKMTPSWTRSSKDSDNLSFYVTEPVSLPVGGKLDVTISYTGRPSAPGQESQPSQQGTSSGIGADAALPLLVVLVGGGAVALTIFLQVKKGR